VPLRAITRRHAALSAFGLVAARSATADAPVHAVRVPNAGIQAQWTLDAQGTLHLVYFSGDARAGDLSYVRSRDRAATWSDPIRVNTPGSAIAAGTIRGAQLALGGPGRVHVAWNGSGQARLRGPVNPDSGKPGEPMLYARLNDAGNGFEPERNLMTGSFGLDGGGSIAADRAGNVYAMWHGIGLNDAKGPLQGEARRQVWIAASSDHGQSFGAERKAWQEATGACGCCGLKAFTDRQGRLHALYRSARESVHRDIYLLSSANHGRTFNGRLLHTWDINACPMSSMDFAATDSALFAAWETGGQVYWARVDSGAKSNIAPVAAPGEGKGRKHPRLAVNRQGELLMVWTEGTGWQRGGSLAWQLYDPAGRPAGAVSRGLEVPTWSFAAPVALPDDRFLVLH
jgi:hypothetical protein